MQLHGQHALEPTIAADTAGPVVQAEVGVRAGLSPAARAGRRFLTVTLTAQAVANLLRGRIEACERAPRVRALGTSQRVKRLEWTLVTIPDGVTSIGLKAPRRLLDLALPQHGFAVGRNRALSTQLTWERRARVLTGIHTRLRPGIASNYRQVGVIRRTAAPNNQGQYGHRSRHPGSPFGHRASPSTRSQGGA